MSEATPVSTGTPTPSVEPISVNSGDSSPVTFDDLDAIDNAAKTAKRDEKAETKQVVKETVKAMEKAKGDKDDKDGKDSKAEDKEAKEGKAKDSEKTGDKEAKGKLGADKEKPKVKARLGEKEIELEDDILIPVKIDGKEELMSLKELRADRSGKVAWDKKFQELDKERRQYLSKVESANAKIKSIMDTEDPELRFYHMAEFSGKDPVAVRQQFLDENIKLLEKYYSMSDDERKADAIAFENKVMKHKLESQTKAQAQSKSEQALSAKIQQLEKTHQFNPETFWNRYDSLQELKNSGKLIGPDGKPQSITPEFVAETIVKDRLWDAAANILDKSENPLPAEKRQDALLDLIETAYMQGMTASQVAEIAEELWGAKSKNARVEEKLEEAEEFRTGKKSKDQPKSQKKEDLTFFSDLF